jgi:uncharacterized membrane protein
MPTYEASITIAAPRESVWPVLSDVVAWPDWLPTVISVQPLQGRSLEVGSRYTVAQPKLRLATWVVTELVPPQRFTWQARSPGLLMVAEHLVEASSPASSQVLLRFSFAGLLGPPVGWLFRSITETYLTQEVASLRRKVEGKS